MTFLIQSLQHADKTDVFIENIASALNVPADEVREFLFSEVPTEDLNCIASKLSKIYPFVSSSVNSLYGTVKKLLGK
jgi:hypothetical protein